MLCILQFRSLFLQCFNLNNCNICPRIHLELHIHSIYLYPWLPEILSWCENLVYTESFYEIIIIIFVLLWNFILYLFVMKGCLYSVAQFNYTVTFYSFVQLKSAMQLWSQRYPSKQMHARVCMYSNIWECKRYNWKISWITYEVSELAQRTGKVGWLGGD